MFASSPGWMRSKNPFGFLRVLLTQLPKVFGVPVQAQRRILMGCWVPFKEYIESQRYDMRDFWPD
jgi:hypothetical protein